MMMNGKQIERMLNALETIAARLDRINDSIETAASIINGAGVSNEKAINSAGGTIGTAIDEAVTRLWKL